MGLYIRGGTQRLILNYFEKTMSDKDIIPIPNGKTDANNIDTNSSITLLVELSCEDVHTLVRSIYFEHNRLPAVQMTKEQWTKEISAAVDALAESTMPIHSNIPGIVFKYAPVTKDEAYQALEWVVFEYPPYEDDSGEP